MRATTIGVAVLTCAGAAGLAGAADTTGSNLTLGGSTALFDVTQTVIAACGTAFSDFNSLGIRYLGASSGNGAANLFFDMQQVVPMGRALAQPELCTAAAPASPGLAESLLIGLDATAVVANQTTSCASGMTGANGLGAATAFAVTSDGTPSGGAPATCPGCDPSDNYTFGDASGALYAGQPSLDALAVLYFGLTHDGGYDCASPVRRSLIRNWKNLFAADCAAGDAVCSGGLRHAWRLGDLTDGTYSLVGLLDPPGKGIGSLPTAPSGVQTRKSNPFCNSNDAQTAGATVISFGGASDFADLDPIRTTCAAGDGVCEPFKFGATNGAFTGDLGVVQVILLPDTATALASDFYPQVPCTSSCTLVSPIKGNQIPVGLRCPGGTTTIGGACLLPYAGTAASPDPRCFSSQTTRCAGTSGRPDGRMYNLVTVVNALQIPPAQRVTTPFGVALDANKRLLWGSFYRIHAHAPAAGNVPDPSVGATGICQQGDDSAQMGCLVDADPCSVGYTSRAAAASFPGLGAPPVPLGAPLKALAIDGLAPFSPASVSADPDLPLENLLQPPGTAPLYPLARRMYLSTLTGFGNLLGGEKELAQCFGDNAIVGPAMTSHRFVAVPGGVQCLDYPEESPTTATPPDNIQGSGNVAFAGCNLGLAGQNACAASPPIITN
ncbi:MAG TPA: hypothetical protein VKZ18_24230 [Polyangia bacterium]|nr:hypothetical protein [Polyangia bacterium]